MFASRFHRVCGWLFLLVAAPVAVLCATPQQWQLIKSVIAEGIAPHFAAAGHSVRPIISPVAIHAALRGAPYLNLHDGQAVTTNYVGDTSAAGLLRSNSAQPLALASADFDGDGVPDLVSGFAAGSGGIVTIHRGNVNALWPYGAALRNGPPPAFLPDARAIKVPEPPDFIGVGDFDADGHWDIVTAHLGSGSMYFLRGDGHGNFAAAKRIALPGSVTAFTTGEINRADGLTDIIVGVTNANASEALVFESPMGALNGSPESFSLPSPATAMVLGMIEGGPMRDLAIGAGSQLIVVHGRDRRLSLGAEAQRFVQPAHITQQSLPFSVKALALGSFSDTASLAVLGDDGTVHLMQNANAIAAAVARLSTQSGVHPTMGHGHSSGSVPPAPRSGASQHQSQSTQTTKLSNLRKALTGNREEWTIQAEVAVPSSAASSAASLSRQFIAGHVSASKYDDLLLLDEQARQVHVLSSPTTKVPSSSASTAAAAAVQTVSQPMSLVASLDVEGGPAAVLPMRVNKYGLNSLVMLQSGQSAPVIAEQTPAIIFTVTNTSDITTPGPSSPVPAGSLRAAMLAARSAAGSSEIDFDIPTTDPNFNPATGVFLFRPLSENVPNSMDNFALPPMDGTFTIDGYTQPGASPNTLTVGDNAKIVLQIDGSLATTPGGSGFVMFDTVGAVIRGFDITGWTTGAPGTTDGAPVIFGSVGVEDGGVSDFTEGNFIGVDPTGTTAAPDQFGVDIEDGPVLGLSPTGQQGNTVGGTAPQARNIISGISGCCAITNQPVAFFALIEGNYIGTDKTGTLPIPNQFDGILGGIEATIGGTLPGAGNLITASVSKSFDLNDIQQDGATQDVLVQGNLIGTDVTGAVSLNIGEGMSIVTTKNITVGGTSPAARNIISGNSFIGVEIADNASNTFIQGNYIGLDVTGTKALPNGGASAGLNNIPPGGVGIGTFDAVLVTPPAILIPPFNNFIGGAVPGAGNVISANTGDGVSIMGFDNQGDLNNPNNLGNNVIGNMIGTDSTGLNALPNSQNGIYLTMDVEANSPAGGILIGGAAFGAGNVVSFNKGSGVLINNNGSGNSIIGNSIQSNGGNGVMISTGNNNLISRNSIFANSALGIALGTGGPNINTNCNSTNTGPNNSQNAPVLTAGSGTAFITATATDPNGNTSEFSNAVAASEAGNILNLIGNFNSKASTTYTLEFFSSPTADPSGFGQGLTFLTSTSVTTAATCIAPIISPVTTTDADMSVALSFSENGLSQQNSGLTVGPDFGSQVYTGVVTNNGPATAHNVVFTDALPASLTLSSKYCNQPVCQSPINTNLGNCTFSANTITCNLGTMAPGSTAMVAIPVQALSTGSITNTATVAATETDPNLANNTSSVTSTSQNPFTQVTQIVPTGVLVNNPSLPVVLYGTGFLATSTVTYTDPNNVATTLPVTAFYDNQSCSTGFDLPSTYCEGIQVTLPQSLLAATGNASFTVSNPGGLFAISMTFLVAPACDFGTPFAFGNTLDNTGTNLATVNVSVNPNVPSCTWTASSTLPWAVQVDNPPATGGAGSVDFVVPPNTGAALSGNVTVAGQTIALTEAAGDSTVCNYLPLNPTSANLSSTASTNTVLINLSSTACSGAALFVQSWAPWITIGPDSGLAVGTGPISYSVTANTGGPRTGFLSVGGAAFQITQNSATNCFFTLSSNSALIPTTGGTGSVNVTASLPTCPWTATTDTPSSVTFSAGSSGTGNGTVQYSVAANTGGPLNAVITVGNQQGASAVLNISEASAAACTITLTPSTVEVSSSGGTGAFVVTPSPAPGCFATAVSNNPTDLAITLAPGTANTTSVSYAVAANPSSTPRTLTITAGCETFTVNQDGAAVANNPTPTITTLAPPSVIAGSGAQTLTVNGSGFVSNSVVNVNASPRTTTFVSATQLTAALVAGDVASVSTPAITVFNPTPGGGTSNSVSLNVTAANNPVPTTTVLSPNVNIALQPAFTLTVDGTNFIAASVVNWNGSPRATTFVGATEVTATITAADIQTAGTASVTVFNPLPGGGTSNAQVFTILPTVPVLNSLVPNSATAGSPAFTLTVNGTNFVNSSVVQWNGSARTTTFVNGGQLTAAITAADILTAGTAEVTVMTPGVASPARPTRQGIVAGGTSNELPFTINATNPLPALTTLAPNSAFVQGPAFTLTVNGSNFISTSVVNWNGSPRATTFVNSGQVTAAITAADIQTFGNESVTVFNPTPGGGTSNSLSFSVTIGAPTLTSLQPSSATAGGPAFTLTVNGSNFFSGSVVEWNGSTRTTTFVNTGQVTAAITAADILTAGTAEVTVSNPVPGTASVRARANEAGGLSNQLPFTINPVPNNPLPALTTLQPTTTAAGGPAFTLTVNGSNFISSSVVQWKGSARTTTFVSATQLTAAITAADIQSTGPAAVSVFNPTPGGGTSNAVTFTVVDFSVSSPTGPQTITAGQSAMFAIATASVGGAFPGNVTFSASGLPTGANASFTSQSVAPGAGSTLTITTTARTTTTNVARRPWNPRVPLFPLWTLTLAMAALLGSAVVMRMSRNPVRRFAPVAILTLLVITAGYVAGCAGGFPRENIVTGTPAGTYMVTVTGTSGSTAHSTTVTLTVQ